VTYVSHAWSMSGPLHPTVSLFYCSHVVHGWFTPFTHDPCQNVWFLDFCPVLYAIHSGIEIPKLKSAALKSIVIINKDEVHASGEGVPEFGTVSVTLLSIQSWAHSWVFEAACIRNHRGVGARECAISTTTGRDGGTSCSKQAI
jgi:hypothetical protein